MPGVGVEGAVRATSSMQQASSVNMLRGIGIQIRTADGGLKGPDEVIEEVWKKLCRDYSQAYGASKSPSLKEVQISLQPGNALDSMLNQYFGNDPMLKQLVANGLIYKAQGGGAVDKAGVTELGGSTNAMREYSETATAGQGFLQEAQGSAESGFTSANNKIESYYKNAKELANLVLGKAFGDTLLTAFGGSPLSAFLGVGAGGVGAAAATSGFLDILNPANALSSAGSLITGIGGGLLTALLGLALPGFAEGGQVTGGAPIIVGEKGPELFVPSSNGAIVPNDKLSTGGSTYTYNITVTAASGDTKDLVAEIKSVLNQIETNRKVSEI